jgi:hypothetical protein
LRSGLLGFALLLGELVVELPLLSSRRFPDLFEFLLKFSDPLVLRHCILQLVGPALGPVYQRLSTTQQAHQQHFNKYFVRKYIISKPTVSASLMVTMLVCKACISSLSSKISSC